MQVLFCIGIIALGAVTSPLFAQLCFEERVVSTDGIRSDIVVLVDLTPSQDGHLDILSSNSLGIEWFANGGNGSFSGPATLVTAAEFGLQSFNVVHIATGNIGVDGIPDIVALNKPNAENQYELVWSVDGSAGRIPSPSNNSTNITPSNMIVADINGDARVELLTDGLTYYEISGGAFIRQALDFGIGSLSGNIIDVADLDGINGADLITDTGEWYANVGGGAPVFISKGLVHPLAAGVLRPFDLNNDGLMDLLSETGLWFRNNGSAGPSRFDLRIITTLPKIGPLSPADLDGDGYLDLVSEQGFWFENSDDFQANFGIRLLPGGLAGPYVVVDVDGDVDKNDKVDVDIVAEDGSWWYRNLLVQGGAVVFESAEISLINPDSVPAFRSGQIGDLDGDGDLDFVTGSAQSNVLSWHQNADAINSSTMARSGWLEEILGSAAQGVTVVADPGVFECLLKIVPGSLDVGNGLVVESVGEIVIPANVNLGGGARLRASSGDVTHNGELVVDGDATIEGGGISISNKLSFLPNSTLVTEVGAIGELVLHGTPRLATETLQVTNIIRGIQGADMDGDGFTDLVLSGNDSSARPAWIRNNSGSWAQQASQSLISTGPDTMSGFDLADFDGDGRVDLVGVVGSSLNLYLNNGSGSTPLLADAALIGTVDIDGPVAIGDLDGDGELDVVHASGVDNSQSGGSKVRWFRKDDMNPEAFVSNDVGETTNKGAFSLELVDLDSDGDLDVLLGQRSSDNGEGAVNWYENQLENSGLFVAHQISTPARFGYVVLGADMDGDGDTDVVVGYGTGNRIAWYENDGSVLPGFGVGHLIDPLGSGMKSLAVGDFDNDGDIDVLSGNRVLYLNDGQSPPAFRKRRDIQGAARHVAAFDFNNDGVIDLVGTDPKLGLDSPINFFANSIDVVVDLSENNTELHSTGGILAETAQIELGPDSTIHADGKFVLSSAARLEGSGLIEAGGGTQNAGEIVVPQGLGLRINGDYAQFVDNGDGTLSAGVLGVSIEVAGQQAPLLVTGEASLGGGLRIIGFEPGNATLNQAFPLIFPVGGFDEENPGFDAVIAPVIRVVDEQGKEKFGTLIQSSASANTGFGTLDFEAITLDELFFTPGEFEGFLEPNDAVLADVTGDGTPDLVVAVPSGSGSGTVAMLIGQRGGDGSFQFGAVASIIDDGVFDAPVAVEVGDFDGNGTVEIAFANRGDGGMNNDIHFLQYDSEMGLVNAGLPVFDIPTGGFVTDLAVGNLEPPQSGPDSPDDLVIAIQGSEGSDSSLIVLAFGSSGWESCEVDVDDIDSVDTFPTSTTALAVTNASVFDSIVYTSPESDSATVLLNNGDIENASVVSFATGVHPTEVQAQDLNGDSDAEIVIICQGSSSTHGVLTVVRNLGSDVFAPPVNLPLSNGSVSLPMAPDPRSLALVDLNEDGDFDIAVVSTEETGDRVVRLIRNTTVGIGSGLSFTAIENSPDQSNGVAAIIRSSDLDGGSPIADDLVLLTDTSLALTLGLPTDNSSSVLLGSTAPPLCRADLNGDGSLDFLDISAFISAFGAGTPAADMNDDSNYDFLDISLFISMFTAGCP